MTATGFTLSACDVERQRSLYVQRTPAMARASLVSGGGVPQTVRRGMFAHCSHVVSMTAKEVQAVAGAMVEHIRTAVVVAAGTGLRQGELFGLTVDRVDFLRRELRVDRQLWSPRTGLPVFAPPKTKASRRTVALSAVVIEALAAHLAAFGPGNEGVVFHTMRGTPVSRVLGGDYIRSAVNRAGLSGITWHSLRHYHASTLLSAGVSPALVAERLGHDVQTLMRTYAHVIRSDDDRVRAVVDEHFGVSAEDFLRTDTPAESRL